jgi:hypothetical protein
MMRASSEHLLVVAHRLEAYATLGNVSEEDVSSIGFAVAQRPVYSCRLRRRHSDVGNRRHPSDTVDIFWRRGETI